MRASAITSTPRLLVAMECLRKCCRRRFPSVNLYGQSHAIAASGNLRESIHAVDSSFAASLGEDPGRAGRTSTCPRDDAPCASCPADNEWRDVSATLAAALRAATLAPNTTHDRWTVHDGEDELRSEMTVSDSEVPDESQGDESSQGGEQRCSPVKTTSVADCSMEVKPS